MITFSQFMRQALYDPGAGYYMSGRGQFGARGDFYTAGQVSGLFGGLLADEFAAVWRGLGGPPEFTIVELGAGRGEFAHDALARLRARHPDCFSGARYLICEISPALREAQRELLAEFRGQVVWAEEPGAARGVVFANEFFDALPVHLVRQRGGRLREIYVAEGPAGARLIEGELSSDELAAYWRRAGVPLREGQAAEINLEAARWIGRVARGLGRGRVITIDYGDRAERLYTPDRMAGTLRCFYRHTLNDRPLERVGEQDMTASVNFTALDEYGRDEGLEAASFGRLTDYLLCLGLLDGAAELPLRQRLALKHFLVPHGLGGSFNVLVQEKR